MSLILQWEEVVYPPDNEYPLYITAKRYWIPGLVDEDDDLENAWTLVLLHATSSHKESWEPTLEKIFELALKEKKENRSNFRIREAWCLDCPNHGASGRLNERVLLKDDRYYLNFTCEKYAQSVLHFLAAGPTRGAKVDFTKRKLCGIGHSLGGNAMCMLHSMSEPGFPNSWPFKTLIIVDPMLSPSGPEALAKLRVLLVAGAYERRDVWKDRTAAMAGLRKRNRTSQWDPRVLNIFVKYGVVPHPGSLDEVAPYDGVTLACTRGQEAAMYRDPEGATKPVEDLNKACKEKPVHLILGGVNDFMPKRAHKALMDPKSGRTFASLTILSGVGHLVPLETPDRLGEVIVRCLARTSGGGASSSATAVKSRL